MQIHETAFVTSTYRSLYEDISKDPYSKLWNNPKTDALVSSILQGVFKDEALLHCLRNRFFYEEMTSFFSRHNGGTLINFGAGFSMYQFCLTPNVSTIEIDKKEIIDYKRERVDSFVSEGQLPDRQVHYVSVDFNTASQDEIIDGIRPLIGKRPTFILLEGVLFFLSKETTNKLFGAFKQLQDREGLIGSVSYLPELEETEIYQHLLNYFDSGNDKGDPFAHQTIPHEYYENLDGYSLIKYIDEFDLSKIYASNPSFKDKFDILNENMYILQRT